MSDKSGLKHELPPQGRTSFNHYLPSCKISFFSFSIFVYRLNRTYFLFATANWMFRHKTMVTVFLFKTIYVQGLYRKQVSEYSKSIKTLGMSHLVNSADPILN